MSCTLGPTFWIGLGPFGIWGPDSKKGGLPMGAFFLGLGRLFGVEEA